MTAIAHTTITPAMSQYDCKPGACWGCGNTCHPVEDWTCYICGHTFPGGMESTAPAPAHVTHCGQTAEEDAAELDANAVRLATCEARGIKVGSVVRYAGRRRRYIVHRVGIKGFVSMVALSGGPRGSSPSNVDNEDLLTVEVNPVFTGARAAQLKGEYVGFCDMWRQMDANDANVAARKVSKKEKCRKSLTVAQTGV